MFYCQHVYVMFAVVGPNDFPHLSWETIYFKHINNGNDHLSLLTMQNAYLLNNIIRKTLERLFSDLCLNETIRRK